MSIYHPYIANDGKHKYFIITNTEKNVKFGAIGYEHYTEGHLDEKRNQRYIMRHKKMRIGIILIQQAGGLIKCYGFTLH